MKILVKQKLILKLTVLAIIPVILSMIFFGSISYNIYKEELTKSRIQEAKYLTNLSAEEIKNPLYFLEIDELNNIIGNIKENNNVLSVYVLDAGGKVVTDGTYENEFLYQTLNDNFSKRSIQSGEFISEIDKGVLRTSAPVIITGRIGTLLINFSLKELNVVLMNIITLLVLIGTMMAIVIMVFDYTIFNTTSKPIMELKEAALEIAGGNFGTKMEIKSDDEIGELADAFNKMASDLSKSSEETRIAQEQIKKSLKEKEVLLKEIHHRVKNNMQIISSLLMLQSQYIKDKKDADILIDSQNRIVSMSLIHEKLYQSHDLAEIDFKEYIEDMVSGLFQSYGVDRGNISLNLNVNNISLPIDTAIPCGLIINELITNSLKYAFPGARRGEIKISIRSFGNKMNEIVVSDDGVGLPKNIDFRKTESLGLHLVTILTENQLHGEITVDLNKGTEFHIRFRG